MLIGIDASRTAAPRPTGTERYAIEITRALIAAGSEDHFLLYFNAPPPPGRLPRDRRVRWRVIPAPRLWTHVRLSLEMLTRPADVLFVPAHSLPLHHPDASVVTVHDLGYLYFPEEHGRAARVVRHWSNRWSAARAARTIAISRATRDDLVAHYRVAARRISIVHHGYSPDFRPVRDPARLDVVRTRHGLGGPFFLFVGTLQPRKNYERLLRAFDQFAGSSREPHLLALAGARGWQQGRLQRALRTMDHRSRVRLLDYVPQDDLPSLMSAADVLVLPSLYEGFGLPALEAMACGTPVLASNTSALPEVVDDAGLLVDPLDVGAIAAGLTRLAGDPGLRADLSARGRTRAAEFTWERAGRETLAVLRDAAGASP